MLTPAKTLKEHEFFHTFFCKHIFFGHFAKKHQNSKNGRFWLNLCMSSAFDGIVHASRWKQPNKMTIVTVINFMFFDWPLTIAASIFPFHIHTEFSDVVRKTWGFPKIGFFPQIIHFHRDLHYKPSILGYYYFWKHPHIVTKNATFFHPKRRRGVYRESFEKTINFLPMETSEETHHIFSTSWFFDPFLKFFFERTNLILYFWQNL